MTERSIWLSDRPYNTEDSRGTILTTIYPVRFINDDGKEVAYVANYAWQRQGSIIFVQGFKSSEPYVERSITFMKVETIDNPELRHTLEKVITNKIDSSFLPILSFNFRS